MSSENLVDTTSSAPSSPQLEGVLYQETFIPIKLQSVCATLLSVTHNALTEATKWPWPVGNTIHVMMHNNCGMYVQHYVQIMEDGALQGLGFVDAKLAVVSKVAQHSVEVVLTTAKQVHKLLPEQATLSLSAASAKLRRRGLVGSAADLWVNNELAISNYSEGAAKLMLKVVPGAKLFVPPLARATNSVAGMVAAWLLKHRAEVRDKYSVGQEDEASRDQLALEDSLNVSSYESAEDSVDDPELYSKVLPNNNPPPAATNVKAEDNTPPAVLKQEAENNPPAPGSSKNEEESGKPSSLSNLAEAEKSILPELAKADEKEDIPSLHQEEEVCGLSSKMAAIQHMDEHRDPVVHLFEYSWSFRREPPNPKSSARSFFSKSALS